MRLAHLAGYDQAILVRMCKGGKDLTGPSGRDRVLRLIATLADEGALTTLDEANALLQAAVMPPLFVGQPAEAHLLDRLLVHTGTVRHGNLPAPLNTLVGRQTELAALRRLHEKHRLVTVVGAGGMGKTRLALHLCAHLQPHFADGVWLIELAATDGPLPVEEALVQAFGVAVAGPSPLDAVIGQLRHQQALLFFDNCEHVLDAVANAIQRLLKSCARLRILATGRAVLDVDGEAVYRVPAMTPADATQLFLDRAYARNPGVTLDEHLPLVAWLCQQLDGMPLAIELAASRMGALSLLDIASRLENHLALLTSQRRGVARRQQTMRATIDWSYALLTDRERVMFARLGIFAGGWTLMLAEDVVSDAELLPPAAVADVLSRLVDQSLVVADVAADAAAGAATPAARYRMLETVRAYAVEQLQAGADAAPLRRRHAEVITAMAEASFPAVLGREQQRWLTHLRTETANWRKALTWCLEERGDVLLGLRLIWGLTFFWHAASDFELEARHWIALAKKADPDRQPALAQARLWAAGLLFERLPPLEQVVHSQRALRLFEQSGDVWGTTFAQISHAWQLLQAEATRAAGERLLMLAASVARALGDGYLEQTALGYQAILDVFQGDLEQARQRQERRLAITRALGDLSAQAQILPTLCNIALSQKQYDDALALACQARRCGELLGARADEIFGWAMEAEALRVANRLNKARQCAESALAYALEHLPGLESCIARLILIKVLTSEGDVTRSWRETKALIATVRESIPRGWGARYMCDVIACIASQAGDAHLAARMFGAADVHDGQLLYTRWPHNDAEVAPHMDKARLILGASDYASLLAEGQAMSYEQAVEHALAVANLDRHDCSPDLRPW